MTAKRTATSSVLTNSNDSRTPVRRHSRRRAHLFEGRRSVPYPTRRDTWSEAKGVEVLGAGRPKIPGLDHGPAVGVSLGYGFKSVNEAAAVEQILKLNFGRPSFDETEIRRRAPGFTASLCRDGGGCQGTARTSPPLLRRSTRTSLMHGRDLVALCKDRASFSRSTTGSSARPSWTLVFRSPPNRSRSAFLTATPRRWRACLPRTPGPDRMRHPRGRHVGAPACRLFERGAQPLHEARRRSDHRRDDHRVSMAQSGSADLLRHRGRSRHLRQKAIANGFSFSALVGRRDILNLGGCSRTVPVSSCCPARIRRKTTPSPPRGKRCGCSGDAARGRHHVAGRRVPDDSTQFGRTRRRHSRYALCRRRRAVQPLVRVLRWRRKRLAAAADLVPAGK